MNLTRRDVLQANTVIISGLLVLYAIQSLGFITIEETTTEIQGLKATYGILNGTLTQDAKNVIKYGEQLSKNPNDLNAKFLYDESIKSYDNHNAEFSKISIELAQLDAKMKMSNSIPFPLQLFAYPKYLLIMVLMPFVLSSLSSIIPRRGQELSEVSSKMSRVSLAVGIFFIVIAFYISQQVSVIVAQKLSMS